MKMAQKIALRIGLIGVIIVASNFIYKFTTYESDLSADANILRKFEHALEQGDALYFSSSPNATYADGIDTDTRSISQMVNDSISSLNIMSVDTGAIHAGVFKKLIEMITAESDIKHIFVHLNYRSFGVGWQQSELENAIQKEMVFYNNRPAIVNRFLQGLNAYEAIDPKERKRLMLASWASDPLPFDPPRNTVESWCAVEKWGDWTNPKRQLADHYIKNFAFTLDETNPRVADYDDIVTLCEAKGITLTYVILPENLEEAADLVDHDLVNLMVDNKNWLKDRYLSKGVQVVDVFDQVADEYFLERHFPSEHYFENGRRIIASEIIKSLKH